MQSNTLEPLSFSRHPVLPSIPHPSLSKHTGSSLLARPEPPAPGPGPRYLSPPMSRSPSPPKGTSGAEEERPRSRFGPPATAGRDPVPQATPYEQAFSGQWPRESRLSEYQQQTQTDPPNYQPRVEHEWWPAYQTATEVASQIQAPYSEPVQGATRARPTASPASVQSATYLPTPGAVSAESTNPPSSSSRAAKRKGKAHVQSACANCKRAHLSCDVHRPCYRCVQSGKEATCVDVEHKKRGRPRLGDDRRPKTAAPPVRPAQQISAESSGATISSSAQRQAATDTLPLLRPLESGQSFRQSQSELHGSRTAGVNEGLGVASYQDFHNRIATSPVAFLDLDLTILRTNQMFAQAFGNLHFSKRNLERLLDRVERTSLARIRSELREERDARAPSYLPPIRGSTGRDSNDVPFVEEVDVAGVIQGYNQRSELLHFIFPSGGVQSLRVDISLARTTPFFVVLILPPDPVLAASVQRYPPRVQTAAYDYPPAFAGAQQPNPYDTRTYQQQQPQQQQQQQQQSPYDTRQYPMSPLSQLTTYPPQQQQQQQQQPRQQRPLSPSSASESHSPFSTFASSIASSLPPTTAFLPTSAGDNYNSRPQAQTHFSDYPPSVSYTSQPQPRAQPQQLSPRHERRRSQLQLPPIARKPDPPQQQAQTGVSEASARPRRSGSGSRGGGSRVGGGASGQRREAEQQTAPRSGSGSGTESGGSAEDGRKRRRLDVLEIAR